MRPRTLIIVTACCLLAGGCGKSRENRPIDTLERERAIELLRGAYAAFNRGDIDAAVAALDPNVEWIEPAEFPGGGTYHGRAGAKQYLMQSRASSAEVHSEPERLIPAGDRIVVFVHARVRGKDENESHDVRLADVYTFRNGQVIRMQAFADRQQALQSVGSRESIQELPTK